MSKQLSQVVETMEYDNLINDYEPKPDVFSVTIRQGQKAMKRGTALAKAEDGKMVILGTAKTGSETAAPKANCILAEASDDASEGDVTAVAYRVGHFNENVLIVAEDYTITDNDREDFRTGGILLDTAMKY
mgnify:CR=1 FL=1